MGADVSGSRKRALLLRNGLDNAVWVETGTGCGDGRGFPGWGGGD